MTTAMRKANSTSCVKQRDKALEELGTLADNFEKRGEWIEQLQRDQAELRQACEALKLQCTAVQLALDGARKESLQLRQALAMLQADQAALQQEHQTLAATHNALVRLLTFPLRVLPLAWQARVKKWARRGLLGERNND